MLVVINIETDMVMPEKNRNDRQLAINIFGTTAKQFAEVERVFRDSSSIQFAEKISLMVGNEKHSYAGCSTPIAFVNFGWNLVSTAGLAVFDEPVTKKNAFDHEKMTKTNCETETKLGNRSDQVIVDTFKDPDLYHMKQATALGTTKTKDLAKLISLFLQGKIICTV
uniref:Uncharacterized protein n=1 Tax=Onchocerca volvulus TaxID=6282 RepID=A0A8R1TJT2_ONCVO